MIARSGALAQLLFRISLAGFVSVAALSVAEADGKVTQFKQAIAEAASVDDGLAGFYRDRGYDPMWIGEGATERREAFLTALAMAGDHGLPVAKYDIEAVKALFTDVRSQRDLGALDVKLTALLLDYARDLQTGILTPKEVDPGFVMTVPLRDGAKTLLDFAAATDPDAFLRGLAPDSPEYARLMRAKLSLEADLAAGGWGADVASGGLEPGAAGDAVLQLRNRLIAMGYLARTATAVYDDAITRAVQAFQADNGITPDGVAGESTIAELNRPIEDRLKAIVVAMERERWVNKPRGDRYIWVNLTDFTAQIRDFDHVTFETRAVIGANQGDRRSPEFDDVMEMMVINPTWSVPRSITVKEYLPMLQRNPNAAGHLRITDRSGRVISRDAVDFTAYNARNFPFAMHQPPSDGNALGKVKFLFPNQWNIYLHDTPAKELFGREVRAFSHGCIRLGNPFEFAYALLAHQTDDPEGFFKAQLDTDRETTVPLEMPLPVFITYRTAFTDAKGHLQFRRDIYGRDAEVWSALEAAGVAVAGQSEPRLEG
jgi:L,D-transpeptidase YcbB